MTKSWKLWEAILWGILAISAPAGASDSAELKAAEIKTVVDPAEVSNYMTQLGLENDRADFGQTYFFDDPDLTFFDLGVVVRLRYRPSSQSDLTVKLRPTELREIEKTWVKKEGFKCEIDAVVGKSKVTSCSLTVDLDNDEVRELTEEQESPGQLLKKKLTQTQIKMLKSRISEIPWNHGKWWGPVGTRAWKIDEPNLGELSAEMWFIRDAPRLLEISIKTKPKNFTKDRENFLSYLERKEVRASPTPILKTRYVLKKLAED